ncbi:ABC transporter permease [Celeribacter indicus]|uniref:ABC transporter permease n=1 Tax=Celeribacter indicus TaxID=1208324 RepID=A0A0B5E773_9RHOB|nr:FtsX-like permease family protein [Celeribacter indicus]AJE48891.1 ABC transporter permease [Celeribacter indicus]SDW40333.1 putative ABC transport system permease protein [Celeribacter indicus]
MRARLAWSFARRELRAGVAGFRVLVICLVLGVAAIAAVTSVREAITQGLSREGAALLGGDAEMEFTYRFATGAERAWMDETARGVSEVADFRSMLSLGDDRALTQVKAVDAAYPLVGTVLLSPDMPLSEALAGRAGVPGIVLDPMLFERLGLSVGDEVTLGGERFVAMAELTREPDGTAGGFTLGPRSIVSLATLRDTGLLAPGTLFEAAYRLDLPEGADLDAVKARAEREVAEGAFRWRDARNGAPGVSRFVDRLGAFLVLVGLAGLAVGGVGVSSAVRAYLDRKIAVIATLKTLGADRVTILMIYLMQVGVLSLISVALGLLLGGLLPLIALPFVETLLPVPVEGGVHLRPLLEAGIYGVLASAIFVLWPLARVEKIRPAALYRDAFFGLSGRPRWPYVVVIALLLAALVGVTVLLSESRELVLWTFLGLALSFLALVLAGRGIGALARWLSRRGWVRGLLPLRLALGAVGGPGGETVSTVLSLGLGLTVLSAIGQIDANLRGAIDRDLPDVAPSYYVVDIQPDQIDGFLARVGSDPGVSRFETAPMLRGNITRINGEDAVSVAGPHWVLRGDRGITYSATRPENATVTEGAWWPEDYDGPPQISFSAGEAEEMGLHLGDRMTVNVLGRDITGEVTSFREVDFSGAGMGFILTMDPAALEGAPHSHIATLYIAPEAEAALIRDLARTYPNITTIRVRDAIDRVVSLLEGIAAATTLGAVATLVTGAVVLIGAAAAGEERRRFEAAVLKTLGASRGRILAGFALRSLIVGAGAGAVAFVAGAAAAWAVIHFVMEADFVLSVPSALFVIAGGVIVTLASSLLFSWRAMAVRPARILRASEG